MPAEGGKTYDLGATTLAELELGRNWTAVVDGDPVACGGAVEQWPGRNMVWLYSGKMCATHMLWLTREALKIVAAIPGRLELTVRHDFAPGHRWARMLGFEIETPVLRAYAPDGANHVGYSRVN